MIKIKSIEQAKSCISRKLGVTRIDLDAILKDIDDTINYSSLSYRTWANIAEWCITRVDGIPYRLFAAYIKTISLRES